MIVRKLEALFTINTNALEFQRASSQLDKLANHAGTVMKTIAGYWAVQALQNFVTNTASAMAEIGGSAKYIGISADALQELHYAAEKSGVSVDALNDAIKEIQVRATDAQSGKGEAAEAFKMLGLRSTDAAGRIREPLELLDAVADRLKELQTHSERLWAADAIFGDEGSRVLKMLKDGSLGIKTLREEARATGRVLGGETIAQAERLNRALFRLKSSSLGVGRNIARGSFDSLSFMADGLSSLMEKINAFQFSKSTSQMANTGFFGALAIAATKATQVVIKNWAMLRGVLAVGGKALLRGSLLGMLLLLLQDLLSFLNGADSITGVVASAFDVMSQGVSQFAQAAWPAMVNGFKDAFSGMEKEFSRFSNWLTDGVTKLVKRTGDFFAGLVPDFLKNGLSSTVYVLGRGEIQPQRLNDRLAPTPQSILNNQRLSHNQNVSVAVNVKSGANPQEIGAEVVKVFKKEFERERFNAFMGVTQYAG